MRLAKRQNARKIMDQETQSRSGNRGSWFKVQLSLAQKRVLINGNIRKKT